MQATLEPNTLTRGAAAVLKQNTSLADCCHMQSEDYNKKVNKKGPAPLVAESFDW